MSNEKKPEDSWVEMTELVLPQHTNQHGTAFGGTVVSWVDIAASACAMRHCEIGVVTASIDAMHFLSPVKRGWIINIFAAVNYTGKTSLEVGVKVLAENPLSQRKFHTASAYLTMVALDEYNKPTPIPQILPQTEIEKERFAAAKERKKRRLEVRDETKKRKAKKNL